MFLVLEYQLYELVVLVEESVKGVILDVVEHSHVLTYFYLGIVKFSWVFFDWCDISVKVLLFFGHLLLFGIRHTRDVSWSLLVFPLRNDRLVSWLWWLFLEGRLLLQQRGLEGGEGLVGLTYIFILVRHDVVLLVEAAFEVGVQMGVGASAEGVFRFLDLLFLLLDEVIHFLA